MASLVDDIAPGSAGSDPTDLTAMGGELYFSASNGTGRQLWKSDGTAAGTVMLTDVPGGADPEDLTAADGELFFSATDPAHGRELGRSDGTVAGTAMVTDVNPGPDAGLAPADISPLTGTTAMFSGDDGVHGREPWVTDGTSVGTQMYDDLNPGAASSDPADITATVESLGLFGVLRLWYFSANDAALGREVWTSDGCSTNTALAADINPGPAGSDPADFTVIGQNVYFSATDGRHGRELWKLTVPPTPQIVLVSPGGSTVPTGTSETFTAVMQANPGEPDPAGRVTFYEDGNAIGTAPLIPQSSGGPAASVTSTAQPGTHQIVAVYQGDGTYTPATSNTGALTGDW